MMKSFLKVSGVAATVPLLLMACAENENGNNNDPVNGENGNNNNNNDDSASADEVEDLAAEYDLSVTTGENGGEGEEVSLEELEEAFELIATAQDSEMLEFQESPEEGEAEESGTASAEYAVPGVELEEVEAYINLDFSYELDGDLDDEERFPTFSEVSDIDADVTGDDLVMWSASSTEAEMAGAGTIAEITSEGEWELLAVYDGVDVEVTESDEWTVEFGTDTLAGIEESEE